MESFKQFSKGLLKSMSKPIRIKRECYKCGTLMPIYSGKYPDKCPWCKELLKINKVNEKPKLEKGKGK